MCQPYLKNKHLTRILIVMEWPVQSSDLNPIKLLLEQLGHMVWKAILSKKGNGALPVHVKCIFA